MNRSYRLILNEITHTWVAVAEIVKGRGKRTSGAIVLTAAGILGAVTLPTLAAPPNPLAVTQLPTGGQVVAGQATVQQAGSNMTVTQTSNRAAMDWATFNVGSEAQVNFLQPSSSAAILNRVLDPNPSQIFGRINANGQVFLTNPSGIYFGPSASANVGALTATTHSISNAEFMDGKLNFTRNGATGKVENEGTLTAALGGYIALLAPEVLNNGVIVAKMGTVALAAGELVEMQFEGSRLANVRVEPATIAALVENGNAVQAPGGLVILSALAVDRLQGGVVRNRATIEANGLSTNGGVVRLTASDSIENTGAIHADAAPNSMGIGGAISLVADLSNPNSLTRVSGSIIARGGDLGGDGGFIETSASHLSVSDSVRIDTRAVNGKNGQWLLDPVDITIGTDVSGSTIATTLRSSDVTLDSSVAGSGGGNITVNDNINVTDGTFNADTTLTLKASGSITINASKSISRIGSNKLNTVLWADNDGSNDGYIKLGSGSGIATNGGHIWMGGSSSPGGSTLLSNGLTVGNGYAVGNSTMPNGIQIDGASLTSNGGDISLYGLSSTVATSVADGVLINALGSTSIESGAGRIWIDGISRGAANGDTIAVGIHIVGSAAYPHTITSSSNIALSGNGSTAPGTFSWTDGVFINGYTNILATLGGNIQIIGIAGGYSYLGNNHAIEFSDLSNVVSVQNGNITFVGDSLAMGGGKVQVSPSGTGTLNIQPKTTEASIDIGGVTGTLNLPSTYFTSNFKSGFSNITVGNSSAGSITVNGTTTLDLSDNTTFLSQSTINLNSLVNAAKDLTINSNGAVTQTSPISVTGTASVMAGSNPITLDNLANNFAGAVNLSNSGSFDVSLRDANALQLGVVNVGSGSLTVQTGGALTQTGSIVQETNAAGVSLNAGNYDITLNNIGNIFASTLSVVNAKKLDIVNSGYMKLGSIATSDDIFLSTVHGDLELSQLISTTKAYSPLASAIVLSADSGASAKMAGGGNITVQSGLSPAITTGGNGVIQLLTGTINGSYVGGAGTGSGRFRYGSDEQPQKSYSTPLLDGINVIYREQPKFLVTPGIATSKYGDTASTGGVAASVTSASPSTYVNGDTASITSGIATFTTTATSTSHVGSYDISYSGGLLNSLGYGYIDANAGAGKYSITPRTLIPTLSNTGVTKTYDGTIAAPANFTPTYTISGQLAGDTPALSSTSATYDTAHVGATKVVVSGFIIAGIAGSNGSTVNDYVVDPTPKDVSASITAKQINASAAITGVDKTYDGLLAATGSTISGSTTGAINGDTVVLDTSAMTLAFDSAHAGNHSISGSGIATLGVSGVGVGTKDGTTGNEVAGATGDYALSAQPTATAVTKAITAKTLIASAAIAGADKTYDGLLVASGSTISGSTSGAINGDSVVLDTSAMTLAFDNAHAGNHSISASGLASLGVSGVGAGTKDGTTGNEVAGATSDYALSAQPTVTAVTKAITAKTLTITGTTASDKTYDGTDIANINPGSLIGLVLSEKLNVKASGTFDNKNAGGRTATAVYTLIDGNNGGFAIDYNLANTTGHMATITQKPLTITANNDAKFVTQSDAASYNGVSYNGLVPGEGGDVLAGTLAYTRTNATSNSAGSYSGVLVPSGLTSNNYAISYANGDYTIVPADRLLVTVQNGTFTYGSDPAFTILSAKYLDRSNVIRTLNAPSQVGNTFSYNDGAGGTAVFTIGPLSAPQSTAGQIKAGSYNVDASNVTETSVNFDNNLVVVGAMTVAQKALIAKTSGATKVYDGNNAINNVVVGLTGLVPNDLVTLAGNGAFSQKSVGTNLAYSVSNVTLGGADASNYFLSGGATVSGTNGAITPKALAISGITVANKTYDGNNLATVSTAGVTSSVLVAGGMVAGDVVQVAATGTFNDKNAATGKTVTLSSLYSGSDIDNYTITDQIAATANITPKALTITGTSAVDKTYDGNTTAVILPGLVTGFVGNENVAATANGTFDSKDAGIRSASASYTLFDGTNGGLANNYRLDNTTGHVATISKASLTVTADSKARLYGQTNPPLTTSVSGFVNGETASTAKGYTGTGTATTLADISTPAGIATVMAGAGSLSATNYDFTHLVDGVLTIQPLQALVLPPKVETRQLATPATDPPWIADRLNSMIGAAEPKDDDPACIGPADKTNMRCRPAK